MNSKTGLLDDLDERNQQTLPQPGLGPEGADSSLSMMDLEMPDLPDDTAADAEAILKANADDGSDEFSGFDGVDARRWNTGRPGQYKSGRYRPGG